MRRPMTEAEEAERAEAEQRLRDLGIENPEMVLSILLVEADS